MLRFIKSDTFNNIFSFVIGLGFMALLKPVCKGDACRIQKAPPYEEVKKSTYQLGASCYKFEAQHVECPPEGFIEPFIVR